MPNCIAIDIVALPDLESMSTIMALNEELRKQSGIISHPLDTHSCLPHVSLNMCGILSEHLPLIRTRLEEAIKGMEQITARAVLQTRLLPDGQTISEFRIDDARIMSLHDTCLPLTEDIEIADVPLSAYVPSDDLKAETVQWTASFRLNVKENGYHPHITMNIGDVGRAMDFDCTFDRIALCQLGNYCTCRKILASEKLIRHTHKTAPPLLEKGRFRIYNY